MILLLLIVYAFLLPAHLFNDPYATVVLDEEGRLLGARIAEDEQWRFPPPDSIPEKFSACIRTFEDRYFYYHPGVNPVSLFRALFLNIKKGKVVSGGSTLSMQTIRLSRKNPPRTVLEKLYEIILATRLEWSYSKDDILNLYASHAPFGGITVGISAAAWRYFQRPAHQLSWAESATLAVLPNAPGLIHTGKNRELLREKRDHLLAQLRNEEIISEQDYRLSLLEPIPEHPAELTNGALHLTALMHQQRPGKWSQTTISSTWQEEANRILQSYQERYAANGVFNGAVLVAEVATGEVKAYVGNYRKGSGEHGIFNDLLQTPRSSGSILKPFLYNAKLSEGLLYPRELVEDVPTIIAGFKPENFVQRYDGAVPADEALWRSLNIPAVLMLRDYGIEKFRNHLKESGFTTITRSADNYGLSLILGGAEVTAWELAGAYQRMAQRLRHFDEDNIHEYPALHLIRDEPIHSPALHTNAGAIYTTFEALQKVNRPDSEMGWQYFRKANIAWKTGTSFGHRDAWAVGITPTHIAVVWIGNADGEGRPGLVGAESAGPVLFDLLNQLPQSHGFPEPHTEMKEAYVCPQSGLPVSRYCPEVDTIYVPLHKKAKAPCPYHQQVFTDVEGRYRLHRNCAEGEEMLTRAYFVLPPVMAWYYAQQHADYGGLPDWRPGCDPNAGNSMQMIYPEKGGTVFLPHELDGSQHRLILEVAHQQPRKKLYWHLNGEYIGHTEDFHQKPLQVEPGAYRLLIEDEDGQTLRTTFKVVGR